MSATEWNTQQKVKALQLEPNSNPYAADRYPYIKKYGHEQIEHQFPLSYLHEHTLEELIRKDVEIESYHEKYDVRDIIASRLSAEEIVEHIEEKLTHTNAMIEINARSGTDSYKEEIIAEALEELLNELQES